MLMGEEEWGDKREGRISSQKLWLILPFSGMQWKKNTL